MSVKKLNFSSSCRAQSLPYFMIIILTLVAAWAGIINIAKILHDRMLAQNAADNAALAVAQYQARVLNVLNYLNNSIGTALAAGAYPMLTPIALYNQHYVGHPNDSICKKPAGLFAYEKHEESRSVDALANLVKSCSEAQEMLVKMYPVVAQLLANEVAARQEYNSDDEKTGADMAVVFPLFIEGLKKNDLEVKYFKTVCHEVNWFIGFPPKQKHAHIFLPEEYKTQKVSWYYIEDKNKFASNRKVTVSVMKKRPEGYPVFGSLLGIKNNPWVVMPAVASAGVYNPHGPSFPLEKNNSTGMSLKTMPIAMEQLTESLNEMRLLASEVGEIPIIGGTFAGIVGVLAAGVSAIAGVSVAYAVSSKETPIRRFDESSNPESKLDFRPELEYGWEAHLVPVGGTGMVH